MFIHELVNVLIEKNTSLRTEYLQKVENKLWAYVRWVENTENILWLPSMVPMKDGHEIEMYCMFP